MASPSKSHSPPVNPVLLHLSGEFALLVAALCRGDFAEADRAARELARLGYHVSVALPRPSSPPGRGVAR